ncbi:MAG: glucosyl transferase, partial [Ignavibacteriae bacterium]|nr:glucosyl transferase [Ignavibacteriota bacterium]NOH00406.1 glucosyl transferase [Ignavibacteriota bacterium]
MKNLIPTLLVIVITILSCNPSEPENNQEITLKVEDVSCIEARLNIQTNNISLPVQINLTANSSLINQFTLTTSDSLIVIDSLQPNSSYTFQATISNNISSNSVNAVTMDTTSHDFNWQTFTFGGDGGSSYLKDVAIINENNIWAVGEIYENGEKYNAVQWNGIAWKLRKILVNFRGDSIFLPLEGIRAFAESDIWLVGSLPIHGNGKIWTVYDVRKITNSDLSLSQAWGHSSEDIYFVGRSGSIAHYDGNNWRKIESGTNLDVYDIWGDYNEQTGEYAILAVAAKLLHSADRDILKIAKNGVEKIDETGIDWSLRGIWFK